jgi:hypothetical protein
MAVWVFFVLVWCLIAQWRKGADVWMTSPKSIYKDVDV